MSDENLSDGGGVPMSKKSDEIIHGKDGEGPLPDHKDVAVRIVNGKVEYVKRVWLDEDHYKDDGDNRLYSAVKDW